MKLQPHSPRPWSVTQNDIGAFVITDSRGCVVAEIDGPYTPSLDRTEADARLIKASPDLLAACHVAVAFLDDATDGEREEFDGEEVLAVLRHAIRQTLVSKENDGGE
jgi:hypothetical protein